MINIKQSILFRTMYLLYVTILTLSTTSCLNDEIPFLTLESEPKVEIEYDSQAINVEVKTNRPWNATSDATWCKINNTSGVYAGTLSIEIEENDTPDTRKALITVTVEQIVKTIEIIQNPDVPNFQISSKGVAFTNKSDSYNILITSNHPWKAVTSSSWCQIEPSEGDGNGEMKITVDDNTSGEERKAEITFIVKANDKPQMLSLDVRQSADSYYLELPITEYHISKNDGIVNITYLLNGNDIDVKCETNVNWLKLDHATEGRAIFDVERNIEGKSRNAIISFYTTGQSGKPEIRQAKLEQSGVNNILDVLVSEVELQAEGEEIEIYTETNTELQVISSSKWCKASIMENNNIKISAPANDSKEERKAYITVFTNNNEGNKISKTITITQTVKSDLLELPLRRFSISSSTKHLSIPYLSGSPESEIKCECSEEWIDLSSISDGYAVFDVNENTSGNNRTATLAFIVDGGNKPIIRRAEVTQESVDNELDIIVQEHTIQSDGKESRIPFTANTEVEIKTSSEWCKAVIDGSEIVVTAEGNFTGKERTGYITLTTKSDKGNILVKTLTIHQEAIDPKFSFEKQSYSILYDGGTNYMQLESTGEWKLMNQSNEIPEWISSITPTEGDGDALITIVVKKNQFGKDRKTQLAFRNEFLKKSISVDIVQEKNPNGIEDYKYLGAGYDASGEYAYDGDVRSNVLDIDKLLEKGYIADVLNLNRTDERFIYGKTVEEYQKNLTEKASISAKFMGFKSSVSNSFSKETLSSSENEYSTFRHITQKQAFTIIGGLEATNLKECVIEETQNDIDNMIANKLFEKYGTHVIVGFVLGGSLDYAMSADVSSVSSAVDWSVTASAGFKFLSAGVNTSIEYGEYEKMKKESANFESSLKARGGESQYASQNPNVNESTYNEWLASLEDKTKWVMVDFYGKQLIPIWEFASKEDRKQTLESAAKKYLTAPKIDKVTTHRKLTVEVLKLAYTSNDAGNKAEMEVDFYWKLDNQQEVHFGHTYQEIPINMGEDPNSWVEINKTINKTVDKLSIYKPHTLTITMSYIEQDSSSANDLGSGSYTIYFDNKNQIWRHSNESGPEIKSGETFIISGADGRTQLRFTWEE